jgi:uncharacterized pyridoxal phosphate-dependent enzyme
MGERGMTRREMVRRTIGAGTALAAPGLLGSSAAATAGANVAANASTGLHLGPDLYQSIGVRPLINARGTYTIISGSLLLPEVREAMAEASKHYVHLDELTEAVGARLAALTGAEWGMVSSGCAAALTHGTAACVAGGNPDLHVRIPNLTGFQKDEVIIPKHSRNVYDAALRAVGVRVVEVNTMAELEAAFGPRTALVYILAGPAADASPISLEAIAPHAKEHGVPILVDAAAEILTIPNVHLQKGATLVAYSGGKCLRGPQCAGLILGRKDILKAAWVCSAPHHGHGRTMKVGKEEMIGMLAALEMWAKRDHKADDAMWLGWMNNIANRVKAIEGVTTAVREPRGLSNHSPGISINWDPNKLNITGEEASRMLDTTEPRILLGGGGGGGGGRGAGAGAAGQTGVSITAYMMSPGDDKIVADRLFAILSAKRPARVVPAPRTPAGDLSGRWTVRIEYAAGTSEHTLHLKQTSNQVAGTHQGDFTARDLNGSISGDDVRLSSNIGEVHGAALSYRFTGKLAGDKMSGELDMGEYLTGKWSATRTL